MKELVECVLLVYMIGINLAAFFLFCIDKKKAILGNFRISENKLLIVSGMGGALGSFLGMHIFRHKIRNEEFCIGVPLMIVFQIFILVYGIL